MPGSSFLKVFLLFSVSCLVALGLFEAVLRVFVLYEPPPDPMRPKRADLYQTDETVGYRLWPSTNTFNRYPIHSPEIIALNSNSDGFRNPREYDEPDPRPRILVVGDSFVFGEGVEAEERLTEVLEALEPSWRVDNLSMPGWGIDLMVRGIEHVGLKAEPDVIVLAVYTDDFRRLLPDYAGLGHPVPKFELVDGELVTQPYPAAKGWRRLRLFQFLYHTYWKHFSDRNRYELNEALLDRFLEITEEHDITPVAVFIPGKREGDEDRARRQFFQAWAESRQVAFLDLTQPIEDVGVAAAHIPRNWHWNELGHRVAAEALHEVLTREVFSKAPSTAAAP